MKGKYLKERRQKHLQEERFYVSHLRREILEDHQSFDSASILTAKEQGESSELSEIEQKTENIMLLCKPVVHPHHELCVQLW